MAEVSAEEMNGSLQDFIRLYKSSPDCRAASDHEAAEAEAAADDDDVLESE